MTVAHLQRKRQPGNRSFAVKSIAAAITYCSALAGVDGPAAHVICGRTHHLGVLIFLYIMDHFGNLLSIGQNWSVGLGSALEDKAPTQELRVTAFHDPPYILLNRQANGTFQYDGYLYQLWKMVAQEANISYRMVPTLQTAYGSLDFNGTWNGLVGDLAYDRADVALTWISQTLDRASVIDFIDVPVVHHQPVYLIRQGPGDIPEVGPDLFGRLLKPLHMNVWWMLLVSLLALSVVLCLSVRSNSSTGESRQTGGMSWDACFFASFKCLVGQGWESSPQSLAGRVVTIFSWTLGILIYVNYTANLISHLTTDPPDMPIKSLREFSEQPDWVLAVEHGTSKLDDLKTSPDVYERAMYQRYARGEGYLSLEITEESIRRVLQPKVLVWGTIERLFYWIKDEACELVPLLDEPPPETPADFCYLAMAKGQGNIKRAVDHVMKKLSQSGIISRLKRNTLNTKEAMCRYSGVYQPLSFGDLLSVLVLLPLAAAFSVIILVAEAVVSSSRLSSRRSKTPDTVFRCCGNVRRKAAATYRRPRRNSLPLENEILRPTTVFNGHD